MSQEIKICSNSSACLLGGLSAADTIYSDTMVKSNCIIKVGGTSSQFLKADGSSDSSAYTTCVGTLVSSDITGFTCCTGTVVAGDISSFTDCLGDITEVTTCNDYLTGGGLTGAINIGLDAACATKWDNASAGGVTQVTAQAPLSSTNGTTPGISLDCNCTTNWNAAYTDSQNTKTCLGLDCVGTLVSSDITGFTCCTGTVVAGDISSFTDCVGTVTGSTAGALLSTNNGSTCMEFGINSGALDYLNQSACAGIDCVGTVVAGDISGFTDCLGDITEVTTCGDYLTGGGLTGAINIGLKANCAAKWDNASAGSVVAVTATAPLEPLLSEYYLLLQHL